MSKRTRTVVVDDALEERVNTRRVAGKKIRSFSDVAREAMAKGLDVLEQERQSAPPEAAA
jgi:predicted component of type VI protein secretion system